MCLSRSGTVLLVQGRRTGIWSFPKGHLKPSETAIECALRELKEETGLILSPRAPFQYKKLAAGSYFFVDVNDEMNTVPEDTAEVCAVAWVPVEKLGSIHGNIDVESFRKQRLWREWEDKIEVEPIICP